jgi:hypothetical protein
MMQCASDIKEISLKGVPDENIKLLRVTLENIWQNLRLHFNIDCTDIKNNQNVARVTTVKEGTITGRRGKP